MIECSLRPERMDYGYVSVVLLLDAYSHVLPDMQEKSAEKLGSMLFGRQ